MCMCMWYGVSAVPEEARRGTWFSRSVVTGSHETPFLGTRNWTQVFWKNINNIITEPSHNLMSEKINIGKVGLRPTLGSLIIQAIKTNIVKLFWHVYPYNLINSIWYEEFTKLWYETLLWTNMWSFRPNDSQRKQLKGLDSDFTSHALPLCCILRGESNF